MDKDKDQLLQPIIYVIMLHKTIKVGVQQMDNTVVLISFFFVRTSPSLFKWRHGLKDRFVLNLVAQTIPPFCFSMVVSCVGSSMEKR